MGNKNKTDESILAQKAELASLVQYQQGSIVSRTLLNKSTGTITLFAFDKDQSLSEHTAPYDATVLIIDGVGEILINGVSNVVETGGIIIMPANIPHAVKASNQFKMLLIMIRDTE